MSPPSFPKHHNDDNYQKLAKAEVMQVTCVKISSGLREHEAGGLKHE